VLPSVHRKQLQGCTDEPRVSQFATMQLSSCQSYRDPLARIFPASGNCEMTKLSRIAHRPHVGAPFSQRVHTSAVSCDMMLAIRHSCCDTCDTMRGNGCGTIVIRWFWLAFKIFDAVGCWVFCDFDCLTLYDAAVECIVRSTIFETGPRMLATISAGCTQSQRASWERNRTMRDAHHSPSPSPRTNFKVGENRTWGFTVHKT
jgi:hypothetical protein